MSYRPVRNIYNLTYSQYPGLHVRMKSATLGEFMDISGNVDPSRITEAQQKAAFAFLESKLLSWDVEHPELMEEGISACPRCGLKEGDMLPATMQGIMCLESPFVLDILNEYIKIVGEPAPKASPPSSSGGSPEALRKLGMLQSPVSLPTPSF